MTLDVANTMAVDIKQTTIVQPVRYFGASLAWNSWLPTMPEQLANMINMAMRIERLPGERVLRASQEPFTASGKV